MWRLSAIAIAPDGKTVYVLTGLPDVIPINTRTNKAGLPIRTGEAATALALSPSGKTAYVGSVTGTPPAVVSAVYPIATATDKLGKPVKLGRTALNSVVNSIAITPDGTAAYVATDSAVYRIDRS